MIASPLSQTDDTSAVPEGSPGSGENVSLKLTTLDLPDGSSENQISIKNRIALTNEQQTVNEIDSTSLKPLSIGRSHMPNTPYIWCWHGHFQIDKCLSEVKTSH